MGFQKKLDRTPLARRNTIRQVPTAEAKQRVIADIAAGAKVDTAMAKVNRTANTYKDWMKTDSAFRAEINELRSARADAKVAGRPEVPDFDEFCRDYLFEPLFPHQVNMWDVIEGRTPRHLDPAMTYDQGDPGRVIINIPPNHAKTTSITINYVTWLIHCNPGVSVAIVSKSQNYAKKILAAIKARLTDKRYRKMHLAFAPEGGWRDPDMSWNATMIYVQGKYDGETEKEPTVEAVGMEGQIYGGRFNYIFLDDVIDNTNAHQHEGQVDWSMTILDSRLPPDGGSLIVVGTRMASTDLNSELRAKTDEDGQPFFTYLSMPAVLHYGATRDDDVTLWPWSTVKIGKNDTPELRCFNCYAPASEDDTCCDNRRPEWLYVRWNGRRLARRKFPLGERRWSLVWQQQQVPDDATFNARTVTTSINHQRQPSVMREGAMGHRERGMQGLYVVGGLDPATVGFTAAIVAGLDRETKKRWIMDGFNIEGLSPAGMRTNILRLTDQYHINEWVIERNAFQKFLTDDPELRKGLQARGCKLTPHFTNQEKVDPDFGIMSLAPLFESTGVPPKNQGGGQWRRVSEGDLIELPDDRQSGWVRTLTSQLIAWEPSGMAQRQKTDLVMALWFTDIAFKKILSRGHGVTKHLNNPWAAKDMLRNRHVVNLADLRIQQREDREAI